MKNTVSPEAPASPQNQSSEHKDGKEPTGNAKGATSYNAYQYADPSVDYAYGSGSNNQGVDHCTACGKCLPV